MDATARGTDTTGGVDSGVGSGPAGVTSTYSSTPLASGNPASSVINPSSSDPTTFKKPETSPGVGTGTGVGSGAALAAASTAFQKHNDTDMPGSFPGEAEENPYAASTLDPRVDSSRAAAMHVTAPQDTLPQDTVPQETAVPRETSAPLETAPQVTAAPQGTVHDLVTGQGSDHDSHLAPIAAGTAVVGATGAGAYEATQPSESTMTTTDPAERSTHLGGTTSKGVDSAIPAQAGGPPENIPAQQEEPQKGGIKSKVLGALGIGAGAAGAREVYDDRKDAKNSSALSDTTTSSIGPPAHHRKESIPTTAYPAGIDSPKATSQPTGGTIRPAHEEQSTSKASEYLAPAAVGVGATGVAGGLIAEERHRSSTPKEIEEQARRDSWRVQAAGAYSGGPQAYDSRSHLQEQRAAHAAQTSQDPAAAREQHFQKVHDMPYGTKAEQKAADKEAVAAVSGLSGAAGLGLGKSEAATGYRDQELDNQRSLDDPEGRALGGPGLGSGAKDAAKQYRESEYDKQRALPDPEPGNYSGSGLGSGLRNAGADYSARELEREKGISHDESKDSYGGTVAATGAGLATAGGAAALAEHERTPQAESTARRSSVPGVGDFSGRRPSATMYGLTAADAADKERYDVKTQNKSGKQGFFRRIFKRRKHADTGEDEDYSSEEEHESHHAASGGPTTAPATTSAATPAGEHTTASGATFTKPTYNPFKNPKPIDSAGHV